MVFSGVNKFRNFSGHATRSVATSKADFLDFLNIFVAGYLGQMNLHDKNVFVKILFLTKKCFRQRFLTVGERAALNRG